MEFWFSELQTKNIKITCRVRETLHYEKTPFQELAVLDTHEFGRMLVLDGAIQTTIEDEFVYHEMITHVPLFTHPNPRSVAVIGGGDGGTVREILKHESVEDVTLIEIDERVVEASKKYFPEISCGLADPRVTILTTDGIAHVRENPERYDVIIVDSTDPVGPAVGLFSAEFYGDVYRALRQDGILVAQSESPFFNDDLITQVYAAMSQWFPIVKLYLAGIPTYPSGSWSFMMGSKKHGPFDVKVNEIPKISTRYYTPELHKAAFALPRFVEDLLISK